MLRYLLVCLSTLFFPSLISGNDYPGRDIYPMVEIYATQQLAAQFNNVIIVDVRSTFEYETLHINGAVNIPLNDKQFIAKLQALRKEARPLVFYCNGHKCFHSYRAFIKAKKAGIGHIYAYDSGIFDWARAHPELATLMGQTPLNPAQLISKSKLKKHLLQPEKFMARVDPKVVILDIREPAQRGLLELFPYRQENISLSQTGKLARFLKRISTKNNNKTLLVYDEGGTQVRWLQYYLEQNNIQDYYFMAGGIKQYFQDLRS